MQMLIVLLTLFHLSHPKAARSNGLARWNWVLTNARVLVGKKQRGWPHTAWLPPLLHDQCDETTRQLESPEAFYLSPVLIHILVSDPGLGLHASFFDSSKEGRMVTFGL